VRLPKARAWVPERAAASSAVSRHLATCVTVTFCELLSIDRHEAGLHSRKSDHGERNDQRIAGARRVEHGDLSLVAPGSVPACDFSARSSISPVIGNRPFERSKVPSNNCRTSGRRVPDPLRDEPGGMNCQSPFPRCAQSSACPPCTRRRSNHDYRGERGDFHGKRSRC